MLAWHFLFPFFVIPADILLLLKFIINRNESCVLSFHMLRPTWSTCLSCVGSTSQTCLQSPKKVWFFGLFFFFNCGLYGQGTCVVLAAVVVKYLEANVSNHLDCFTRVGQFWEVMAIRHLSSAGELCWEGCTALRHSPPEAKPQNIWL